MAERSGDTALDWVEWRLVWLVLDPVTESKAPSPLRSAGAFQKLFPGQIAEVKEILQ